MRKKSRHSKLAAADDRTPRRARTVRVTREQAARMRSRTDSAALDAMTDADIERRVAEDPDAPPLFTEAMLEKAVWVMPRKAVPISLRVDPDVLAFYKSGGPGYQSRMNSVLRAFMEQSGGRKPGKPPRG